jgi:hypothetical protein
MILNELFSGRLLDLGRFPVLSVLIAAGGLTAIFEIRQLTLRRLLLLGAGVARAVLPPRNLGYLLIAVGIPPSPFA